MADVTNEFFFVSAFISSQAESNCGTTPTPCEMRAEYSAPAAKSCVQSSMERKGMKKWRGEGVGQKMRREGGDNNAQLCVKLSQFVALVDVGR